MSDLLGLGQSGISAYANALAVIGNNVANANTPGYTRRGVTLQQNIAADATQAYYTARTEFGGVLAVNVTRATDSYRTAAARGAASEAGYASAHTTWLSNAETALNDTTTGVGQSATAFFNAGNQLAADPGNSGSRQQFLASLDQAAASFRTTAGALADTSTGIANAAETSVHTVNSDLDALDRVNASLVHQVDGSSAQADLMDQRDQLIDDLSNHVGLSVHIEGNGTATVSLANSPIQLTAGLGNDASVAGARFALTAGANGTLSLQAVSVGSAQAVSAPGGELGGLIDSASTVADRRNSLNVMATNFINAVNGWQAAGVTPAGTSGAPLLAGTDAASMKITTSDPTTIASGLSGGAANGNLLNLSSLRGAAGVEQSWAGMVTDQGQMVAAAKSANTAAASASESANTARDAGSAVDLNTEAANMIRYQQAYNGAAKVIQVAKDTMQAIFQLF
ncbi:MAG TPA: flagellar hook-associated protein FlgK [Sphingomonas sp.]|nr:flagellar hook-associated protein FlgK [Sphingomonas sp.]